MTTSCPGLLTVSAKVVPMCSMKACGGVELKYLSSFLNMALVGAEWSYSGADRFTFGDSGPGVHSLGDWMGPKNVSGPNEEVENPFCICWNSSHDFSVARN